MTGIVDVRHLCEIYAFHITMTCFEVNKAKSVASKWETLQKQIIVRESLKNDVELVMTSNSKLLY